MCGGPKRQKVEEPVQLQSAQAPVYSDKMTTGRGRTSTILGGSDPQRAAAAATASPADGPGAFGSVVSTIKKKLLGQ